MIFYFSATGNSKYVANRLAEATNDIIMPITDCLKENRFDFVMKVDENIGFVTPTYFWGLPTVVIDFIRQLNINKGKSNYVYHILTFGTTTGQAHCHMNKCLRPHNISLDGKFIVQMTDTWTPIFDLSDTVKNQRELTKAEKQIDSIIEYVNAKKKGDFNNRKIPFAQLYYPHYHHARKTKKFTVDDSCIGCTLCEKQCPVSAIKILNNRPFWIKERCALCLGCLHRCPMFSIQYGKSTRKHGQYVNPNIIL